MFAWTDSSVVLGWLQGNLLGLKTFVGNWISTIMELIPPDRWHHVSGNDNPADCASRGLFPTELDRHELWWNGLHWLCKLRECWPTQPTSMHSEPSEEKDVSEVILTTTVQPPALPILGSISSFTLLKWITVRILCFASNCWYRHLLKTVKLSNLTAQELSETESYWILVSQQSSFVEEITNMKSSSKPLPNGKLICLHPFLD